MPIKMNPLSNLANLVPSIICANLVPSIICEPHSSRCRQRPSCWAQKRRIGAKLSTGAHLRGAIPAHDVYHGRASLCRKGHFVPISTDSLFQSQNAFWTLVTSDLRRKPARVQVVDAALSRAVPRDVSYTQERSSGVASQACRRMRARGLSLTP